ncbi:TetR/AcrR family transcriptional regulator [Cohnella sp. JJ-181]|uniref:TetR/AcrR family transcriptional regulator n=1 Tax=Cohnella rhizoplanae TaxID=2974897 RepID=UPI0022FF6D54|nr:TetR/AcrR family transcriptional regulator [Cohnella sp. JJ-181]CAI6086924.1 hypothetical protein COHCIP112018_05241 [Cohnella sp. JJ-181]
MSPKDDTSATRKDQILDAAAELFAQLGYYKTTTALVAKAVGVTQPYVFHFFRTKEELFLAVLDRGFNRLTHAFAAVESPPEELAHRMGYAFEQLLVTHRNEILLVMQAYSIPEPAIREEVKAKFVLIHERVGGRFAQAGIPNPNGEAGMFIGTGLLIALSQVLDLPRLLPWCETE